MILLHKGDRIGDEGGRDTVMRVLWLDGRSDRVVTIDLGDAGAWPKLEALGRTLDAIAKHQLRLLECEPVPGLTREPSEKQISVRDLRWRCIQSLVANEPEVYDAQRRARLVAAAAKKQGVSTRSVKNWLLLYWHRGMTPNALLAGYERCGAPGQRREPGEAKRGRPRKHGSLPGLNVNRAIAEAFAHAVHRSKAINGKLCVAHAFSTFKRDFVFDKTTDRETGDVCHVAKACFRSTGPPTERQFRYWFENENNFIELARKALGPKKYPLTCRGLTGTITARTLGPGARYEIDATVLDYYVVSRVDGVSICGRPTLYFVVDVFSRMIVGMHVSLEHASWPMAMSALANVVEDKVAYCRRFGIQIEGHEWPQAPLPGALLSDRGEIESAVADRLFQLFGMVSEVTAPHRGDWKPGVERRFGLLPAKFAPFVPGYVEKDAKERGVRNYALDAVLNVDEITAVLIHQVLYFNNHHQLRNYDPDPELLRDKVPFVPTDLWAWGTVNRSGAGRRFPFDLVRFALMPTAKATVTPYGIRFRGAFYTCLAAERENWFDIARMKGSWEVKVSFDPRQVDEIYLHKSGSELAFEVCTLTQRSRAIAGLSLLEVEATHAARADEAAGRSLEQDAAAADAEARIEAIVAGARARTAALPTPTESDAKRLEGIRANRSVEKAADADRHAFRLGQSESLTSRSQIHSSGGGAGPAAATPGMPGAVPPRRPSFAAMVRSEVDFGDQTISELLRALEGSHE